MGLFDDDDDEEEIVQNYQCMYDDCEEWFEDRKDRIRHSLKVHWDINPKKYPHITGADSKLLFDTE